MAESDRRRKAERSLRLFHEAVGRKAFVVVVRPAMEHCRCTLEGEESSQPLVRSWESRGWLEKHSGGTARTLYRVRMPDA